MTPGAGFTLICVDTIPAGIGFFAVTFETYSLIHRFMQRLSCPGSELLMTLLRYAGSGALHMGQVLFL